MAVALLLALAAGLTLPGQWRGTERREASLPQLEAQAAREPGDGPLLALVGAGRMAAGENAAAADALRRAVATGEANEDVWIALAANTAATGDRRRALADLHLGLAALPASTALQGALAQARVTDAAAPPAALAAAIDPLGPGPLRARYASGSALNGLAEWWGGLYPERGGVATRQGRAGARPRDAQAQRLRGEALVRDRRPAEAGPFLARAAFLAPDSPAAALALADWDASAGESAGAARQYLACLKLRPHWQPALLGFGAASLQSGLNTQALAAYQRATALAPSDADAWIGMGRTQARMLGPALAAADFDRAARLAPARTDFLDDYAESLRLTPRAAEAEPLLRRRLQAAPEDALAHYLLGLVLRDVDPTPARMSEAEAETRESLRLSPHNPLADAQLGQIRLDAGRAGEAVALFEDARARTPFDPKLLLVLARAYARQGKAGPAAAASARAQSLLADRQQADTLADESRRTPTDIGLHRRLASLYARLGRPDQARQEADTARLLRVDPSGTVRQRDSLSDAVQKALTE